MIEAVVLAGGRGERLRPLTDKIAKPAILVAGKPIISYSIDNLKKHGINNILVKLHYLPHTIKSGIGWDVDFIVEKKLKGTAYFLKKLDLAPNFLVVNGDTITNVDIEDMFTVHVLSRNMVTIFTKDTALHTGGTYIFNKSVLKHISDQKDFMIVDLIAKLEEKNIPLTLYKSDAYYFDCGTPEKLEKARKYFNKT